MNDSNGNRIVVMKDDQGHPYIQVSSEQQAKDKNGPI
jgi:hypothetical protein